jgi:chemotaxis protein CheX
MKAEQINPFIASTVNVFSTMLSCPLERGTPYLRGQREPQDFQVTGIIGLTGRASGTVVLTMTQNVAVRAAEAVLGTAYEQISADVVDMVGELTNMIAGSAKAQLESLDMSVSLPTVITGSSHAVQFPSKAPQICVPFQSPWGALCLEVGLVEKDPPLPNA